jgi:allophanate hydrolase
MIPDPLEIATIHAAYRDGTLTPLDLVTALLERIEAYPDKAVFISRVPAADLLAAATSLEMADLAAKPLFGIPFVAKDNIDVAGMWTTAACPDFAYMPKQSATVIEKLQAAGAILLGKANLDQFATGLNGTRSPFGAPRCVFDAAYISGGSSSGSAVAAGAALCVFSLGTDTAGSGRVPAMFNNLVGLKPTVGRIAARGVVPACKSLDCVSIFANSAADAVAVLKVAEGYDAADAFSRLPANPGIAGTPRIGILAPADRVFAGDEAAAAIYEAAIGRAVALGWAIVEIDYAPFLKIAQSLYGGAFVAERLAAIKDFFKTKPDSINPVVRDIIEGAEKFSAADLYAEIYNFKTLARSAAAQLQKCDFLILPTAPTIFTVEAMLADPLKLNALLGTYTNFVNLMDLASIAVPIGFRPDGLPVGVTLVGPAFCDVALAGFAETLHVSFGAGAGKSRALPAGRLGTTTSDDITLVVAGAHLSGMVLNHELLALNASFLAATTTAPNYRLFALATTPPKPGLVRVAEPAGPGIAVELWSLNRAAFGTFVAALPAPMGIGKVTLADGSVHPGFLCEAHALENAQDITAFGGWRAYLKR